jgi:methylmalonyl-CoA/ethylmalonyl-CoA epimerase
LPFTERFDHVSIGVREVEGAAFLFRDVLGGDFVGAMEVPDEGFRFVQYRYPNRMKIELMEPIGRAGFLTKFLDSRGEGVHHLSFKVGDIDAHVDDLRSRGIEPVHVVVQGPWKEAFIHPRQAHGVLIQLLEMPSTDA